MIFTLPLAITGRRLFRNCLFSSALALLLAGCASIAPPISTPLPGVIAAAEYHDNIDLGGRLSVLYQQNGKNEAVHGSFSWSQTTARTQVLLLSPLGQTMATIDVTPTMSTLTQANQAPRSAANVDALADQALGWPLPVAGLRHWLQGFVIDAGDKPLPVARTDAATIDNDGWHIQYTSWQNDAGATSMHPKRIDLERSTAAAGPVAIRIVIDSWQAR